ncbi:multicopper oxidase domain-containing protein [Tunturiibacter gelidiferens]|uniref:multicopper oxidase domain-containing protein n=1 Tax=Tunturiibacter gelidiferens TaxID=3069689 RepID=UPI003D9BFCF8
MLTRRRLLQRGLTTAAGFSISKAVPAMQQAMASPAQVRSGVKLTPYVDALPTPPTIRATGKPNEIIDIEMRQFQQKVHRDLPPTTLWGYNGCWPGPTIEAESGQPLSINWISKLPTAHLLPIDHSIHGAESSLPAVRNVAHLHGACTMPDDDGYPEAWFTAQGEHGPHGSKFNPRPSAYPNCQPSTALWYHDHCLGITRLNVYAGLAGFYLIRDEVERALNLPQGDFEIPLMLQDRLFHHDGSLFYPKVVNGPKEHPVWIQEFYGDYNCVNGKVTPSWKSSRAGIASASSTQLMHASTICDSSTPTLLAKSRMIPSTCRPSSRSAPTAVCFLPPRTPLPPHRTSRALRYCRRLL